MEDIYQSDEKNFDGDVVDYASHVDDWGNIRLRTAIDVNQLLSQDGVLLDPILDDDKRDVTSNDYFMNSDKDIEEAMASIYVDDDCDGKFVDIISGGGVKKKIISLGDAVNAQTGDVPDKSTVVIQYSMSIEGQDEPFDSTYLRGRSERFRLDESALIPGLEIAIKSMRIKEKAEFIFEPDFAFGHMGCPPRIPGDSQILARVELLNVTQDGKAESILAMNPEERNQTFTFDDIESVAALEHKEGNRYYEKKEYKLAARKYRNGIRLLESVDLPNGDFEKRQKHQILKLYLNCAQCYLKLQYPRKTCVMLDSALKIDSKNSKGLYRMGKAKRMLCNYHDARKYLVRALKTSNDPVIGRELETLDMQIAKEKADERAVCCRMFGNTKNASDNKMSDVSIDFPFEDEDYADNVEQLTLFKDDPDLKELVLPKGISKDQVQILTRLTTDMGLHLVERNSRYAIQK